METKTHKGEETKNRLITSGQKLFYSKGFEATSVREIVEDAGYAKGTFYLYFDTKMELLVCITLKLCEELYGIIADKLSIEAEDPFIQMENLLNVVTQRMIELEGSLLLLHTKEILELLVSENMTSPYINAVEEQIMKFLSNGIESGHFRCVNVELYSKLIFSMIHGLLESAILFNFPAEIQVVRKELGILLKKILEK